jgi:phosphatidate cytidylyltransferase
VAKRALSSLVLWTIVLSTLWYFRSTGAVVIIALITFFTLLEFYKLLAAAGDAPFGGLGAGFGALIVAAPWTQARFGWPAEPLLALATLVFAIRILGERPPEKRVAALAATVFGLVYVAGLLQYFVRILVAPPPGAPLGEPGHLILCLWVVAVAKFSDVGGLLAGMAAGRTPLAPQISPKKTWEGAVGGVLVAMGIGAFVAWLGRGRVPAGFTPAHAALVAAPVAVAAIIADLIESMIKRRANSKDSGGVIPGIGGMFDMSDSLILAAPVAYFLLGFR